MSAQSEIQPTARMTAAQFEAGVYELCVQLLNLKAHADTNRRLRVAARLAEAHNALDEAVKIVEQESRVEN